MDLNMEVKNKKESALDRVKLELKRIKIYRSKVPHTRIFPKANGRVLKPVLVSRRKYNFLKFVDMYFTKTIDNTIPDPEFGIFPGATKLTTSSDGYRAFARFAQTDYGSSVIKEMLNNPKRYSGFVIAQGIKKGATGGYKSMTLSKVFPNKKKRFLISGQKIFDLAIIYHEFAHTSIFLPKTSKGKKATLLDERKAVMLFENPVRIRKGYEPRYTYSGEDKSGVLQTINIITGKRKQGKWTVSKYDPRILVSLTDEDRL